MRDEPLTVELSMLKYEVLIDALRKDLCNYIEAPEWEYLHMIRTVQYIQWTMYDRLSKSREVI